MMIILSSLVAVFVSFFYFIQKGTNKKKRDKKQFDDATDDYLKSIGATRKDYRKDKDV